MILHPPVELINPPLRPDRDSVREGDPANGVNNPLLRPHTLPPETTPNINPANIIFDVQTYTLASLETKTFLIDSGADFIWVYIPAGTADKQANVCLGAVLQADITFRMNAQTNANAAVLKLPARSQQITIKNVSGTAFAVTVLGTRNCDFYAS